MPALLDVLGVGVVIGIVPLVVGFAPAISMRGSVKSWRPFSAGLAIGFMMLFFTDLIDDSGGLGVSSGLSINPPQITLASLFFLGFALFFLAFTPDVRSLESGSVILAYLVALGMGLHAMGEGMIVGNNLAGQVTFEDFSTAIQGLSFALHKFLEGFTIAVFFGQKPRLTTLTTCLLLAGLPFLFGIPLGVYPFPAILANFLFAAGAGAAVFVTIQLTRFFSAAQDRYKIIIGFLVGFVLVYFASLIHFTQVG